MKLEEVANAGLDVEKDGSGESTHKPGCLIETKASITLCVCARWACPQEHVGHVSSQSPVPPSAYSALAVMAMELQQLIYTRC